MKKSILLISLLAGCMSMSAYTPFVEEGKQWSVITHGFLFFEDVDYIYTTELYKIEGVETVNGVQYNKLLSTSNKEADDWTAKALLREENKKVYALVNGTEYLMYDFDIEIGSKIAIYPSLTFIDFVEQNKDNEKYWSETQPVEFEVSRVDIVKNRKGEDIKKYSFKDTPFTYYERYGHDSGWMRFRGDDIIGDSSDHLVCVHNSKGELEYFENPNLIGVNLEDGECYAWGVVKTSVDELTDSSEKISYDNASESIRLNGEGEKDVTVFDVQGRKVYGKTTSGNEFPFTAEAGLYIVSVANYGNIYTGKIVVK